MNEWGWVSPADSARPGPPGGPPTSPGGHSPAARPVPGWYADPAGSGGLRYWSGSHWTEHTAPVPPAQWAGPPLPAWGQPAQPRSRTGRSLAGAILLALGLLALVTTVGIAAYTVWGIASSTQVRAVVTDVDGDWCTFAWEGPPEPDEGLNSDICPPGAGLGDQVEVLVFPDGSAWTSTDSVWSTILPILVIAAIAAVSFIGVAVWLLLSARG